MADVFVSYSRRDSEFVRRLADAISQRGGRDVWLDTEGIADGEVFPEAIKRAIEQSDMFLFVITPSAVDSAYCENEVEYAQQMQKRILPVLREPVPDAELPAEIRDRNWIPFTQDADFEQGMERLVSALDTDLEATKAHTRWLVKTLEWSSERRDNSFLLRGSELRAAEAWLAAMPEHADPAPTPLQREYVLASRNAAARRQRTLMIGSFAVAAVSIGLLIFALISRSQAITSRQAAVSERIGARAQALAAESQAQLPNDPEISLILGIRAVRTKATPQSMFALRAALDASPLELGLPTIKVPGSCGNNLQGLEAAYSPNGQRIAEVDCNGAVRVLDAASGRLLADAQIGHEASSVAYSPDGATLAVGAGNGVALLDSTTARPRARLAGPRSGSPTTQVAFNPSGGLIAAASPAGVTLWRAAGGRPRILVASPVQGPSLAFTPNGRLLITADLSGTVIVYDVASGRKVRRIRPVTGREPVVSPPVVAVSPDGSRLAVGYPDANGNGVVAVYSTQTWRKQFNVMSIRSVEILSIAFSPDASRLAVGAADGTSGVWSIPTRERLVAYDGPTAGVFSTSFTPDGRSVLTASGDGIARVWRALGAERSFILVRGGIDDVALTGSTLEILSTTPSRTVVRWLRLPGGQPIRTVSVPVAQNGLATISPDGRYVFVSHSVAGPTGLTTSAPMMLFNAATGRVVRRLGSARVGLAQWSPDDSEIALQEEPASNPAALPRVVVLSLASGRRVELPNASPCGPNTPSEDIFSGNARRVAEESFCGVVQVWETRTGHRLLRVDEGGETSSVDLSADGSRLLVSSWDSRATIWNVATGKAVVNLVGHTRGIVPAILSPDGSRVATASLDHTVRVWDARTGQVLRVLTFTDQQAPLEFSTDGSELVIGESTPVQGAPNVVRVFGTCPACQNPRELLKLAAPHATANLTQLESTVVAGS